MGRVDWRGKIKNKRAYLVYLQNILKHAKQNKLRKEKIEHYEKAHAKAKKELDKLIIGEIYEKQHVDNQETKAYIDRLLKSIDHRIIVIPKIDKNMTKNKSQRYDNMNNLSKTNTKTNNNPPKFASSMIEQQNKLTKNKTSTKHSQSRNISSKAISISSLDKLKSASGRTLI